jgi:hypothetical protein
MKAKFSTFLIVLVALACFNSCLSNEIFVFVIPVPFEAEFVIEENDGVWNESEVLSADDFEDILEDYDDDAILDDVSIEGVVLYVENADPNLTGVTNADLVIIDAQQTRTQVYQNVSITLETTGTQTRAIVTDLAQDGVELLKNLIKTYIDNPFSGDFVIIESTGNSVPAGTPLNMDLTVEVNMTANVSQELEVPFFIGN